MLGDGLYGIAMAWWITQELGSPAALAGYALCWFIPTVTLPFIAGSLVDRTSRKALIVAMDSAQGLAVTALAILLATGSFQLWHVYLGALSYWHRAGLYTGRRSMPLSPTSCLKMLYRGRTACMRPLRA